MHVSHEFLALHVETHAHIRLVFVPPNTTAGRADLRHATFFGKSSTIPTTLPTSPTALLTHCIAGLQKSVAILAQAPGLSFRCICHLSNPIMTRFESGFVWCVHRMAPVACRPIIKCVKSGCTGCCPLSVVEYGYTAGRNPATCRTCGKTFLRPKVTLSDFVLAKSGRKKGNRGRNSSPSMSRRSRNVSPAMSRKSSVVSWSDTPREQSEANGEDAVMEDGTETLQAEINKKIKANDKLRKILTNMPRNTGQVENAIVE